MQPATTTSSQKERASPHSLGLILVLVSSLCFAFIGIGTKYAILDGVSTSVVVFGRYVIASSVLWVLLPLLGYRMGLSRRQAVVFLLIGGGPQAIIGYSYAAALEYLSLSVLALIVYLYPA